MLVANALFSFYLKLGEVGLVGVYRLCSHHKGVIEPAFLVVDFKNPIMLYLIIPFFTNMINLEPFQVAHQPLAPDASLEMDVGRPALPGNTRILQVLITFLKPFFRLLKHMQQVFDEGVELKFELLVVSIQNNLGQLSGTCHLTGTTCQDNAPSDHRA